jgi:hypothetical protein
MLVCRLDQGGAVLMHRTMPTAPEAFLKALAPYRQGLVVAVAGMGPWDWLADLGADPGLSGVLGPALSMQALHGGQATHAKRDSPTIAQRWRGGMHPHAEVSPAQRRATRALLRRRMPLPHHRAALLAHVHNPPSPYPLPAMGNKIAAKANRAGGAARVAAPAVPTSLAVALALLP